MTTDAAAVLVAEMAAKATRSFPKWKEAVVIVRPARLAREA